MNEIKHDELAMEVVLTAGKLMIESGADMARVDDTMYRLAKNAGIKEPRIFETTTGIMMSAPKIKLTRIEPINERSINLEMVSRVNDLSRAFQRGELSLEEVDERLNRMKTTTPFFVFPWQLLAAAIVSSTLLVMYGGSFLDFFPAFFAGGIGYTVYWYINTRFKVKFVSEFLGALVIGLCASFFVRFHLGTSMGMITIGAVMPLVPGVPLTNAVRDVLAGHILSGISRGTEALISACAIGFGIAVVLRFF